MKYWESAEVEKSAQAQLVKTAKSLELEIASALGGGKLADVDVEFCYIPIVMGPDFLDMYPSRSTFSLSENKIFHSPQLNFDTFINGTEVQKKDAYIKGIMSAKLSLKSAKLDDTQILDFHSRLKGLLHHASPLS